MDVCAFLHGKDRPFAIGICKNCQRPVCAQHGRIIDGPRMLFFTICETCYVIPGLYEQIYQQVFGGIVNER